MGHRLVRSFAAEREHIDRRELQVRRHAHLGHGERIPAQHVIDDLAAGENLGERMPDQLAHFQLALGGPLPLAGTRPLSRAIMVLLVK